MCVCATFENVQMRKLSVDLLLELGRVMKTFQYIFITPHDILYGARCRSGNCRFCCMFECSMSGRHRCVVSLGCLCSVDEVTSGTVKIMKLQPPRDAAPVAAAGAADGGRK